MYLILGNYPEQKRNHDCNDCYNLYLSAVPTNAAMHYVHRRLLSIRLRLIEKCLFETKCLLEATANDRHFILYSVKDNVDSDLRLRIFRVSSLMIEQIQEMKQEFNLQSEEEENSIKKIVLGNLNEAWSSLKDMKEGKIRGHDQLSYQDKQLLNAHIIKLYSMIESIYSDIHRF